MSFQVDPIQVTVPTGKIWSIENKDVDLWWQIICYIILMNVKKEGA